MNSIKEELLCSFAYVDFSNSDAKVVAITLSEKNLDGRKLLIKDGIRAQYFPRRSI